MAEEVKLKSEPFAFGLHINEDKTQVMLFNGVSGESVHVGTSELIPEERFKYLSSVISSTEPMSMEIRIRLPLTTSRCR